ncbi:MAG: DUF1127 domain-containing protein [Magnetospiraceae bacterium]
MLLFNAYVTGLLKLYDRWLFRHKSRHQLRAMSDGQLKDLGLSRADVDRESTRPFWKA